MTLVLYFITLHHALNLFKKCSHRDFGTCMTRPHTKPKDQIMPFRIAHGNTNLIKPPFTWHQGHWNPTINNIVAIGHLNNIMWKPRP